MLLPSDIKNNDDLKKYIELGDLYVQAIGYTEHGFRHANLVSETAYNILKTLGYKDRMCQLAEIAGYMHDIGNIFCREFHAQSSAVMGWQILKSLGMDAIESAVIASAIGNHEEDGKPVNPVAAATIIADKSDVHRNRVRNPDMISTDIHDRVNFASKSADIIVSSKLKTITLKLEIDTSISQVMEYFEIFLDRMIACQRAAITLGCQFKLIINEVNLI
jgi:metal-dependent HD superfamily phosphatase/phosphodiesterase